MNDHVRDQQLVNACQSDDLRAAIEALMAGADPNSALPTGEHALDFACARNNGTLIAILLRAGADPNSRGQTGRTPLHYAAMTRGESALLLLLAAGANLQAPDRSGMTPVDVVHRPSTAGALLDEAKYWQSLPARGRPPAFQDRIGAGRDASRNGPT